ncbi:MAG: urea ABC transporter permease subunit UrtB, partial [Pseudomonadota bacterium]
MLRLLCLVLGLLISAPALSQGQDLQTVLQRHQAEVAKPSRRTIGPVLEDLAASGVAGVGPFLEKYSARAVFVRNADGLFFFVEEGADGALTLLDITSGAAVGSAQKSDISVIRPNGGVRREIGSALVEFQLSDPDITRRRAAVDAIARDMSAAQLAPLEAAIDTEPDPALRAEKRRLAGLLAARFGATTEARLAAIETLAGDLSVDVRAVLNQILATDRGVSAALPENGNIAAVLEVGAEIDADAAYAALVAADLAPPRIGPGEIATALTANIVDANVAGVPVASLGTEDARARAYRALAADGTLPPLVTDADVTAALATHVFYAAYRETDVAVTRAARLALDRIEDQVAFGQAVDLTLDALSLASIYFLAAIGLAITFGVMGVINMAHGEFIMMGAYTGYVVQLF